MKYFQILCAIFMITLVIAYLNHDKFDKSFACAMDDEFKNESYYGTVIKKFIDQKNHRTRTVILDNGTNILLGRDTSRFYAEVSVGNSVRKIKNNNKLIVGNNGNTSSFIIYFGCVN